MVRDRKSLDEKSIEEGGAVLRARSAEWVLRFARREDIVSFKGWDFILTLYFENDSSQLEGETRDKGLERCSCTSDIGSPLRSFLVVGKAGEPLT